MAICLLACVRCEVLGGTWVFPAGPCSVHWQGQCLTQCIRKSGPGDIHGHFAAERAEPSPRVPFIALFSSPILHLNIEERSVDHVNVTYPGN